MRKRSAALGSSVFFVVAPGVVVGVVPWLLTGWRFQSWLPAAPMLVVRMIGVLLLVAGVAVLLHSFWRFVAEGFGTPAPVAPTERLVVGGFYRYVRNPMYVAILVAVLGQCLLFGRPVLLLYAALCWVVTAGFVRWYEEPTLRRQFGAGYDRYAKAVPAWIPRVRPWSPG